MEDGELVALVRAGDLDAASTLLSRHQDAAYTTALRLMGSPADAEDLAQEALMRSYTRLSELQEHASFAPWLRRIVVNLSLNALRRRGLLQFESIDADVAGEPSRDPSDRRQTTPENAALASAFRNEIDMLIRQLPAQQRVAVVLRDMYDYDVAEIAALQDCGLSAAKMRIARGRTLLRRLVTEAGIAGQDGGA